MFLKKLFLLLMIQDPKMCNALGVDKIIIGNGNIKIFVLRRLICKADFLTQLEQEIFVEKLYVAGREAFCRGDCLIKYHDFIISIEEFERFSINDNRAAGTYFNMVRTNLLEMYPPGSSPTTLPPDAV